MFPNEIWCTYPLDTRYEVSNYGRVKWLSKNFTKIKIQRISKQGYPFIKIRSKGRILYPTVHRMVALTHLDNPPHPSYVVHHKDGVKTNNNINNLQWITRAHNSSPIFKIDAQYSKSIHT